jgi:hypothetical protein
MPVNKNNNQKTPAPVTVVQEPLKDLLVWRSPARPFKQRDREYYTTIAAIIFLLAVILLFLKEWLLIGVIISLGFVAYVLSTVPPEEVENKITTRGVVTGGKRYDWVYLGRFWFSEKWGTELLNIETRLAFPNRLIVLLGKTDKNKVKNVLEKYLLAEKPPKTYIDRAGEWITQKFPLESQ